MDAEARLKRKREVAIQNLNIGRKKDARTPKPGTDNLEKPTIAAVVNPIPPLTGRLAEPVTIPDYIMNPSSRPSPVNPFLANPSPPLLDARGVGDLKPPNRPVAPTKSILKKPKPPSSKVQFVEEDPMEEDTVEESYQTEEEESEEDASEDGKKKPKWTDDPEEWEREREAWRKKMLRLKGSTKEPTAKKPKPNSNVSPGVHFDSSGNPIVSGISNPPATVPPSRVVQLLAKGGAALVAFLFSIAVRRAMAWGMDRVDQQVRAGYARTHPTTPQQPATSQGTHMDESEKKNNPLPYSLHDH